MQKELQQCQAVRLLKFMQTDPHKQWLASDFQDGEHFIGYEAGPRLCDLCDRGLVHRVGKQGRFVLFHLTEDGKVFQGTETLPKKTKPLRGHQLEMVSKISQVQSKNMTSLLIFALYLRCGMSKNPDSLVDILLG